MAQQAAVSKSEFIRTYLANYPRCRTAEVVEAFLSKHGGTLSESTVTQVRARMKLEAAAASREDPGDEDPAAPGEEGPEEPYLSAVEVALDDLIFGVMTRCDTFPAMIDLVKHLRAARRIAILENPGGNN
jgi:hypothetical protein